MGGGLRVEGVREVVRSLDGLISDVQDMDEPLADVGQRAVELAASGAPYRTGTLQGSVEAVQDRTNQVRVRTDPLLPYGPVIQLGGYNNIRPNPFVTEQQAAVEGIAVETVVDGIDGLIRRHDLN